MNIPTWAKQLGLTTHKRLEKYVLDAYLSGKYQSGLDIVVYQQQPYTHAIIETGTLAGGFWHGYAKCNPSDEWNSILGEQIAIVRAARNMFRSWQEYIQ